MKRNKYTSAMNFLGPQGYYPFRVTQLTCVSVKRATGSQGRSSLRGGGHVAGSHRPSLPITERYAYLEQS